MTGEKLRALIERHKMTQAEFADLIGVAHRTVRFYLANGIGCVPTSILVTLLVQKKITIADVEKARRLL